MRKIMMLCLLWAGFGAFVNAQELSFAETEVLAKEGSAGAQLSLGGMYDRGEGISKDLNKAFYWFEKAANQGNPGG
jgi:TPR repeat protein